MSNTKSTAKNTIREKIDGMVKRAIVKTLFEQVGPPNPFAKRNDAKNVYASEDYTSIWDALPEGVPADEPSVSATQADFKRWFIRNYLESSSSPLRLEPSERDQLVAQFDEMDPNQVVEWINANPNELFSFSPYENDNMALVKILAAYTNSKGVRQRMTAQAGLIDQMSNATADGDAPEEEPGRQRTGQGDVEDTLQAAQNVLSRDPTERLNSRQAVDNRIKTALGKLHRSGEAKAIMQFLFDKSGNHGSQEAVMEMIDQLHDRIMEVTADYTDMFIDSMFEAFGKVGLPEEGAESESESRFNQQAAFNQAVSSVAPNASAKDIAAFRNALMADMGDGTTVHETILNKSASDPGVRDAVIRAVMEVFENSDMDMQFFAGDNDGSPTSSADDAAYEEFVKKFVDAMFDAFTEEGPELQQAFAEGVTDFAAKLQASGVKKGIGSQELGVFESVLMTDVDGQRRVVDIFLNGDVDDAVSYDEAWEAAFEKFKAETTKQTLFNSLGDYIDIQPDIVELRHEVFDTVRAASHEDLENLRGVMSSVKE